MGGYNVWKNGKSNMVKDPYNFRVYEVMVLCSVGWCVTADCRRAQACRIDPHVPVPPLPAGGCVRQVADATGTDALIDPAWLGVATRTAVRAAVAPASDKSTNRFGSQRFPAEHRESGSRPERSTPLHPSPGEHVIPDATLKTGDLGNGVLGGKGSLIEVIQ